MSLLCAVLQEADKASSEELKKHCDEFLPRIKDLTERVQLLSFALQQNFVDLYVNFCPTKSLEQLNYKNRKSNILTDYADILQETEQLLLDCGLKEEEFTKHYEKLNNSMKTFNELCVIVEGKKVLEKANHESGRYNFNGAMLGVKELQNQLKSLKFDDKLAKGLSNLKSQAENQLAIYTAQLSSEWEDIFKWTEKKSVIYLTYSLSVQQSDPVQIQKVLKTLYASERLNAELGEFSHFFIEQLLHNVIRHNCDIYTEDSLGALVFNIKIDLNDTKKPNYQSIFNNLTAIFEFLENTLGSQFECDRKFIEVLANSIREKFFSKIINECIKNNLPSSESSYVSYKNIVVELECFNKFLIDIRFVESDKSPLNKYIDDTECVLYNKKCNKLLSDVRVLLFESISHATETVGISPTDGNESVLDVTEKEFIWDLNKPLFLPKCVISQNVKKIMTLIVEHIEESVKLPLKYQKQLVLYIKDIAVMYQTIVPAKFKSHFKRNPWELALFFNNCFYLAHGLVGPPWKNTLPADLADMLTTVLLECIQDLRVLALEKMSLFLQKHKDNITKSVEELDPKEETPWTLGNFEKFNIGVNEALDFIRELKHYWHKALPTRMYQLALCTLVQSLCQSVVTRVLGGEWISEAMADILVRRLVEIVHEVTCMLMPYTEQLSSKISVWVKFTKLSVLLDAELLEVAELWRQDSGVRAHFACEEVRQLVKMRFGDDQHRLGVLQDIQ